jgi:2-polyprenyl-3-methyl-5-hydroxy-6-metoxy-1,4-benzoquinol methylase
VYGPLLPADPEAHILEVGCGLGHFLYFLKEEGYSNHWGIDIGREQVEACRANITSHVEWVTDSRAYLTGRPEQYDAIIFIDVFEHLDDDELFPMLKAVKSALVTDGTLLISVPNAACLTTLVTLYGDLTHRRLFNEGSLTQLLSSAGFDEIRMLPNEKKVIRSFHSRREKWIWQFRDRLARWLLSEFHTHLMEGSVPEIQTVNLLGVARKT